MILSNYKLMKELSNMFPDVYVYDRNYSEERIAINGINMTSTLDSKVRINIIYSDVGLAKLYIPYPEYSIKGESFRDKSFKVSIYINQVMFKLVNITNEYNIEHNIILNKSARLPNYDHIFIGSDEDFKRFFQQNERISNGGYIKR